MKTDILLLKTDIITLKTGIYPIKMDICSIEADISILFHVFKKRAKKIEYLYSISVLSKSVSTIKVYINIIAGLLFLMLSFTAEAQKTIPYFQDFGLEDGLSSTNVNIFFQDSRGIIWIGTSYGLNRYDGTTIKSYTKEDNGLCDNYINDIAEDGKGNLWIFSGDYSSREHYYCILDPITETTYSIEEYTGQPCPFDPNRTFIQANYKGIFLFREYVDKQLQFYEVQGNKIEKGFTYFDKDSLIIPTAYIQAFKLNEETYSICIGHHADIDNEMNNFYHLKPSGSLLENMLDSVSNESLIYRRELNTDGQHLFYKISEKFKALSHQSFYIDGQYIGKVTTDDEYAFLVKGNIYTSYSDRLEKHKLSKDTMLHDGSIFFDKKVLIGTKSFADRSGNIWTAELNEVTKLSFRPQNFQIHLKYKESPVAIRGIDTNPDGTLYVQGNHILNAKAPNETDTKVIFNMTEWIFGLLYDEDKIWFGGTFLGLGVHSLKTQETFYWKEKGLIWQPYKEPGGTIWAGAANGLFKLDTLKNELLPFNDYGEYTALAKSSVYAFHLNEKGTWLSTSSGMYLVDLNKEKVLAYYSDTQAEPFYIPANHIAHIHEDKEGIFWLATKGQGLIKWNPITKKSEQLTRGNTGLSHNVIYAVYEDDFGNLWLPSNYGLNCLNKKASQVTLYLEEDGLPNNEFNTIAHHQDKDGNLYFGTIDGMIQFHPKDFNHEGEDIPFIITAVNRIDRETDSPINMTKSVLERHSLTIKPNDKAADFNFALLDYKKTKGNQYSYKIEGYQDKWIYQKAASLRISGLPYGNYKLLIRGKASATNNWIDYPKAIKIRVVKPFYLQWWFIFSSLLLTGGSIFYLFKRNTKNLLERQEELETIVDERTEEIRLQAEELKTMDKVKSNFFANISHELRTPLTLILGPLSYLLDNPGEWKKANIQRQLNVMQRNGKSLMDLIEEILDLSKLEANKLELMEEGTPVVQFFEYLFFVFEPQFQSQGLEYELILNVKKDLHILMDRKKMEKVLNNFLSNAIKFTPSKGKITLTVTETDAQLKINISDNGKGIHPNDLPNVFERFYQSKQADQKLYGGTGIGLALVNEFAQLMEGEVYVESALGEGSTFYFDLPKKEVAIEKMLINIPAETVEEEQIDSIGNAFTILVVEDNHDMRNFIAELLQNKYERILLAKNGVEGLEMLKEHGTNIHLIISDVMMPEMDGLTMLKEIKSNPDWFGIPVVMLTALAAERDKLTALTIGVDDYLTKPFSVPELLIRVQNLLFNYHQRLEWQKSEEFQKEKQDISTGDNSQNLIDTENKEWINELTLVIGNSFKNGQLDVKDLATTVFLSPRQLSRKLISVTGLSPAKFIKEVRLQAARKALENGVFISVREAANDYGYEHPTTFSNVFKNRFGKSPSEYMKSYNL